MVVNGCEAAAAAPTMMAARAITDMVLEGMMMLGPFVSDREVRRGTGRSRGGCCVVVCKKNVIVQ